MAENVEAATKRVAKATESVLKARFSGEARCEDIQNVRPQAHGKGDACVHAERLTVVMPAGHQLWSVVLDELFLR